MLLAKKLAAWLAFALFTAATAVALLQPVHLDPFGPRLGLDRLLHPAETNAFTRLPSISASLSDLHVEVGEDGQAKLWAVGGDGAILHSRDGGRCWQAQGPWSPPGSGRVCGPRNLWEQMELIPAAFGADVEQRRKSVATPTPSEKAAISAAAYLRPGIQDPRVPALREKLRTLGYETGAAPKDPTLFDEGLAGALREFQRSNEVAADGIVGAQTRRLLDELAAKRNIEQAPPGPEVRVGTNVAERPTQQPAVVPEYALPSDLRALYFIDAETGWAVGGEGTILKTVDGGARWEAQSSGWGASLRAVHFQGAETGWAVGSEGTILKTVDGGARWEAQSSGTKTSLSAVHFQGGETGWAVGGEGTILKTVDGGARWEAQSSGWGASLRAVHFQGAETGWAVGSEGTILKTVDGGARWEAQSSGTKTSLSAVHFQGGETGWAVGSEGTILKTVDGGARWETQSSGTAASLSAVHFQGTETGWAVGRGGTILKTVDGGARWEAQSSGEGALFRAAHFQGAETGWAVGRGGTILKTVDGGTRWEAQSSGTGTTLFAVHFQGTETGWAVGVGGTILKTVDGGARWEAQSSGTEAALLAVYFQGGKTGWAVGSEGTILKTVDGGARWEAQSSGAGRNLHAVHFPGAETGWAVGSDGTILKTVDGGARWETQSSGTGRNLHAVHFPGAETGWAVGDGTTILKTVDGGARWEAQSSGTKAGLLAVHFQGAETGWAAGIGPILKTVDGGARWEAQSSGTEAVLFAVHFQGAETGWAVGDEGTILKTVDGGARWESPLVPYTIAPAPWYWAACLLSVALLGFSAWPQRPRVTERSVADLLASDRPLRDKSEADALDLGVIASSLSEFLRNRNTEAPLTVAVTGDWGSGKTSLMNLLRQDLTDNNFRPVWFNAWHHQKGEQILASLFAHIREQSIPPLLTWRGLRFRWQLLVRRGAPVWLLFSLLLVVLAASVGFLWDLIAEYSAYAWEVARDPERLWTKDWRPVTKLFTALAGIGGSAFGLIRTMQGFGLDPQKLVTVNPQNRKTQGLDPGARARFAREFRDVTECLKPRKMVIFIDDLDRCGQHSLIEVLEAVNFLASSGDCFIVMGMSPSWVEACVGLEYEHLARAMAEEFPTEDNGGEQSAEQRRRFARNYLEKLINIEVPIPGLDRERAGVLVAPEEVAAASGEALPWRIMMIDAVRPLAGAWKPLMLALAVGYGVWFGVDLLHRPEKAPDPPKQVHWSTGEVVLSLPDGQPAQRGPGKADAGLPPPADVQASDPQPPAEPEGGRLARTLSELLGVEISIQADPKTLEKGLVLLEHGKEGGRWQVVLSEPKEPAVESGKAEIEPEAPERSPEKVDEGETRRFALRPGSGPESTVPAWAFAVAAILILAVAWRSSRRGAIEITEDSKDFQDALKIWLPWIMAKQGTPRSVKRFVNWLRYVATRLRKAAGRDEGRFPEPNTVALAAVHNLEPRWLAEDAAFQRVITGVLRELIEDDFAAAESTETLQKVLTESAATYGAWAGEEPGERGPWPPSGEHRDAFLAVINEKQ